MAETITLAEALDRAKQGQAMRSWPEASQAINTTKRQLQAQGLKPPHPAADIVAIANAYLVEHREELISGGEADRRALAPGRVLRQALCKTFK